MSLTIPTGLVWFIGIVSYFAIIWALFKANGMDADTADYRVPCVLFWPFTAAVLVFGYSLAAAIMLMWNMLGPWAKVLRAVFVQVFKPPT